MSLIEVIALAVALAMDCLTVAVVSGVLLGRMEWVTALRMSVLFGAFQALMPLAGWLLMSFFAMQVEWAGHYVAFVLLAFVGGKMVRESLQPAGVQHFNPRRLLTQLLLAVATSIDALAVGVSLAVVGYRSASQLLLPLAVIGLTSLLFGIAGWLLGARLGCTFSRRFNPEFVGGMLLIALGVKMLVVA
ncbi:MAG: manganese efflux pump [Prevotella sp.]|nr:manganese efflux pump [Prevotella sp.]